MSYKRIFEEIKIGSITLKNRTVFPPISTNFASDDGHLTDRFIEHYVRRAQGGVALVTIENSCIDFPDGRKGAFEPRIDSKEFLPDWTKLINKTKKYDAKFSVELTRPGYKEKNVDSIPESKIKELVKKYSIAAKFAKEAGFDMVEIQGAHGLLVNQFLSPATNHRKDEWGKERLNFPIEIRQAIAKECGQDFPVSIRLGVKDYKDDGIDLKEGKRIAQALADAGYNMIQADIGLGAKEKRLEPMAYEEGWRTSLAEGIRPLSVPVAAIGVIRSPEVAEEILEKQADLVILGRTLIADPDWVNKVKEDKEQLIRKCIGCSECIKARHDEDVAIRCGVNPNVGNEEEIRKAEIKKNIAVVGGGPAGLEATRILAQRGHSVHLFYEEFGGQLNMAAVPPGKDKLNWLTEYYDNILKQNSNVQFHIGECKKEDVESIKPDAVVIATGSSPFSPFPKVEGMVYTYDNVLKKKIVFEGKNIVIAGGGLIGCETANFLAEKNNVTIVEMITEIASGMETLSKNYLLKELSDKDVHIFTNKKVVDIQKGIVVLEDTEIKEKKKLECDALIVATGNKPYTPFTIDNVPFYIIGDAEAIGKIVDAVHNGYKTAKEIK